MRKPSGLATAAIAGFAALSAVMMLWWPLGYDHGIFAANGSTLLHGGVPYRDAWETRGPLSFYLFAAIEAAFGRSAFAIRFFDLLMLAAVNLMLWRVVRGFGGRRAAVITAAFWTLCVVSFTYNESAQPDLWVGYATLGIVVACSDSADSARRLFIAGLLAGMCTLLKPFYAGFLLAPAVATLLRSRGRADARDFVMRRALLTLAGWIAPIAVMLGALWVSGAWDEFVKVHFGYTLRVYPSIDFMPLTARLGNAVDFLLKGKLVVVALPAITAGVGIMWKRDRGFAAAALCVIFVCVAGVILQGKFFFYHWEPALVVSVPLAALSLTTIMRAGTVGARLFAQATLAVILLHAAVRPLSYLATWLPFVAGRSSEAAYYGTNRWGLISPIDQMNAARYIAAHTALGTAVANWGGDAAIPFLADRPSASRFPVTHVLILARTSPVTLAYQAEFLHDMRSKRPAYIAMGHPLRRLGSTTEKDLSQELPALGRFLADEYVIDRHFGDIDLYRRNDFSPVNAQ